MSKKSIDFLMILAILFTIMNCKNNDKINHPINYEYSIAKYTDLINKNNLSSIEYYNKKGQLIEVRSKQGVIKYKYNSYGNLKEKSHCRSYNCKGTCRNILLYNNNEKHIGTHFTCDTIIDESSIKFDTIKYYNDKQQLIRELTDIGTTTDNGYYKYWKEYFYKDNLIINVIELRNTDTVWICKYRYDENLNLIKISKRKNDIFRTIDYSFNKQNKLVKKKTNGNKYIIKENTSYTVEKNELFYEYDKQGRLIKEIGYNHKGKKHLEFLYVYKTKMEK